MLQIPIPFHSKDPDLVTGKATEENKLIVSHKTSLTRTLLCDMAR